MENSEQGWDFGTVRGTVKSTKSAVLPSLPKPIVTKDTKKTVPPPPPKKAPSPVISAPISFVPDILDPVLKTFAAKLPPQYITALQKSFVDIEQVFGDLT
jgi:hypothetical protein